MDFPLQWVREIRGVQVHLYEGTRQPVDFWSGHDTLDEAITEYDGGKPRSGAHNWSPGMHVIHYKGQYYLNNHPPSDET